MDANLRKYYEGFGLKFSSKGKLKSKKRARRALEWALDTRKFEIEMYWKRAGYFWALIGVAFAGYFAILSIDNPDFDRFRYAFIVACIGFVFSLAWYLVNKGSKYWQENWENHVSLLEDLVIGSLFKAILRRPNSDDLKRLNLSKPDNNFGSGITKPSRYSVSKVNMCVSIFTVLIWFGMLVVAADINLYEDFDFYKVCFAFGTFFFCWWMYFSLSHAYEGPHDPIVYMQSVSVRH